VQTQPAGARAARHSHSFLTAVPRVRFSPRARVHARVQEIARSFGPAIRNGCPAPAWERRCTISREPLLSAPPTERAARLGRAGRGEGWLGSQLRRHPARASEAYHHAGRGGGAGERGALLHPGRSGQRLLTLLPARTGHFPHCHLLSALSGGGGDRGRRRVPAEQAQRLDREHRRARPVLREESASADARELRRAFSSGWER